MYICGMKAETREYDFRLEISQLYVETILLERENVVI